MRRSFAVLALFACVGAPTACTCGFTGPEPDSCSSPSSGAAASLELGVSGDAGTDEALFVPLSDGDVIYFVHGSQGASMIGLRLRVTGNDALSCLRQSTTVTDLAGERVALLSAPLKTYPLEEGGRATSTFWLPGVFPEQVTVTTEAAQRSIALQLRVRERLTRCDSLRDCVDRCEALGDADCRADCLARTTQTAAAAFLSLERCVRAACCEASTLHDGGSDGGSAPDGGAVPCPELWGTQCQMDATWPPDSCTGVNPKCGRCYQEGQDCSSAVR